MKLIDLLVQELPKRGGWPEGAENIEQNVQGRLFNASMPGKPYLFDGASFEIVENWRYDFVTLEQYEAALAASQKVEWDGNGLPPVGCECEWLDKNTQKWFPVLIKYQSSWVIVIQEIKDGEEDPVELSIDVLTDKEHCKFRPIRSEADKKRDEAIAKITDAICGEIPDTGMATAAKYAVRAYDAIASGEIPHIRIE